MAYKIKKERYFYAGIEVEFSIGLYSKIISSFERVTVTDHFNINNGEIDTSDTVLKEALSVLGVRLQDTIISQFYLFDNKKWHPIVIVDVVNPHNIDLER